jgi:hypothetical protein
MATITPLGGPRRRRDYYRELRDAVAADLTCSTKATRAKVIAARLAYLEEDRKLTEEIRFSLAVSRRMKLLTAPPVEAVEPKRREWVGPAFVVAAIAVFCAFLVWVL